MQLAAQAAQVNWGVATTFVILAGALVTLITRAFLAPARIDSGIGDRARQARAQLEANSIVPAATKTLADVIAGLPVGVLEQDPRDLPKHISTELQEAGYITELQRLSASIFDHARLTRYPHQIEDAESVRAWAGLVSLLCLAVGGSDWALVQHDFPGWLTWGAAGLGLLAALVLGSAWAYEIAATRGLVRLCRRHEQ